MHARVHKCKMSFSTLSCELQIKVLQYVCEPDYKLIADLRLVSQSFRSLLSNDAFWRRNPANCRRLLVRPNVFRPLVVANLRTEVFELPHTVPLDQYPRLLHLEASHCCLA